MRLVREERDDEPIPDQETMMAKGNQAWLVAVGAGDEPLPDEWTKEKPELLTGWPVGKKDPVGIGRGDHLIYYAAHHQKLIAVARSTGAGSDAGATLPVQVYLAIPLIPFAPHWGVLGKPPESMEGQRAISLTNQEYEVGLESFLSRARLADDPSS